MINTVIRIQLYIWHCCLKTVDIDEFFKGKRFGRN